MSIMKSFKNMIIDQEEYNFTEEKISQNIENVITVPVLNSSVPSTSRNVNRISFEAYKNMLSHKTLNNTSHKQKKQKMTSKQNLNTKKITENIQKHREKKQMKLKEIEAEMNQKLMSECTFKPQTNRNGGKGRRNLHQFLESQQKHLKKVSINTENLKQNILSSYKHLEPFKPKINTSKTKPRQGLVYDRLYSLKDHQLPPPPITDSDKVTFTPAITKKSQKITRTIPVSDLLYQDAMRRTVAHKENHGFQQAVKNGNPVRNAKNQKFAAQKFIKDYYYTLQDLELQQLKEVFSLEQFKNVLKRLGFLIFSQNENTPVFIENEHLVEEAYQLLQHYGVNSRNTCVFLLGLQGIFCINPVNFQKNTSEPAQDLILDEEQGRKLQQYFEKLYRNRLSSLSTKRTGYVDQNKYQPQINSQTNQMAQRYRDKMMNNASQILLKNDVELILPENGQISHADLLYLHKAAKKIQLNRKREQLNQIKDPQCTFKPKTQHSQSNTPRYNRISQGIQKTNQLYYQARAKQSNQKLAKQRQKEQSPTRFNTQHPAWNQQRNSQRKQQKKHQKDQYFAKDIEKNIARIYEGRKRRQQLQQFLQRGEKYGAQSTRNKKMEDITKPKTKDKEIKNTKQSKINKNVISCSKNQDPVLVIDVNIGEQTHNIELFRGDEQRLEQIISKFCKTHQLDEECKQQLLQMVSNQVQQMLETLENDH